MLYIATFNLSEPAYLWPYTAYVLLMMGEIVTRNMQSKTIVENKNAIVASCWTYFTITTICSGWIRQPHQAGTGSQKE